MSERIGTDRAVLVHPSVYGHDHSSLIDTLAAHPGRLRAVAVLSPETSDAEIERPHAAGTRGTRINIIVAGGARLADAQALAHRIKPLGWHIQLLVDVAMQPDIAQWASGLGVPVVFDHFGHPSVADPAHAGFRNLCALVREGTGWAKLSAPYRVVGPAGRWCAIRPFVDALLAARADRLVWGSDWPHPHIDPPMPNDGDLADMAYEWLPTDALRRQVLIENPKTLYGFPAYTNETETSV